MDGEFKEIDGAHLVKMAKQAIKPEMINAAMQEESFMDFLRCFMLMTTASTMSMGVVEMGHVLAQKNPQTGNPVRLEIAVTITPTEIQLQ